MGEKRYSTDDFMAMMPEEMKPLFTKEIEAETRRVLDACGGSDEGITEEELDIITDSIQMLYGFNDEEVREYLRSKKIKPSF